jgi:hypothetical protein
VHQAGHPTNPHYLDFLEGLYRRAESLHLSKRSHQRPQGPSTQALPPPPHGRPNAAPAASDGPLWFPLHTPLLIQNPILLLPTSPYR